jgi:hypothetical protein
VLPKNAPKRRIFVSTTVRCNRKIKNNKNMNTSRSVTILFSMITFFAGCSNDAGNSQAGKQETPQTNFIKNQIKEDEAVVSEKKQEMQQEPAKIPVLTTRNIVGVWKSRLCAAKYYTTFVFNYFDNETFSATSYGRHSGIKETGSYKYTGNRLVLTSGTGEPSSICEVKWVDDESVVLTQLNGDMKGSKYYYKLASSIDSDDEIPLSAWYKNGQGITDNVLDRRPEGDNIGDKQRIACNACDGTGKIKASVAYKTDCWDDSERLRPFITDNPDIKLPCCLCEGTGMRSY